MPTWRLVVANQNHDQIGNRARGDRLAEHLDDDQLACAALLTLAGPFTPMLFMGEEWAASTPFQFFTSHPEPELGKATAEGRIAEFERMGWDPAEVPDPQDPETFHALEARLGRADRPAGTRVVLDCYRRLGRLRRELPQLTDPSFGSVSCTVDGRLFTMRRGDLLVVVNAGDGRRSTCGRPARGAVRDPVRGHPARRELDGPRPRGALLAAGPLTLRRRSRPCRSSTAASSASARASSRPAVSSRRAVGAYAVRARRGRAGRRRAARCRRPPAAAAPGRAAPRGGC